MGVNISIIIILIINYKYKIKHNLRVLAHICYNGSHHEP